MTTIDTHAEPLELAPGIHYDVPAWDYFRIPALSSSQLKLFSRSPGAYAYGLEHPSPSTDATIFGNALHDLVLMGEAYLAHHYPPEPSLEGRTTKDGKPAASPRSTKEWKAEMEALLERLPAAGYVLKDDTRDKVRACAASILAHPRVAELHESAEGREVTVVWEQPSPIAGHPAILCKARFDWVGEGWIADLKKFRSPAILDEFPKQAWYFGYFRQAAWYRRAYRAAYGHDIGAFIFPVVCDDPPHEREVLEAYLPDLDLADLEIEQMLGDLALCEDAGQFPVGSDSAHPLMMKPWMREKIVGAFE